MDRRRFLEVSTAGAVAARLGALEAEGVERAGAAGPVTPFSFCAVADVHASEAPRQGVEHLGSNVEKFLTCVHAMEALEGDEKPDFMLILGDVHLWELRKHLDGVGIPVHVIAGNHDSGGAKREMRDLFPGDFKKGGRESDYYSFVHKGVRFIGVCDAIADHVGHLCSANITPRGQCEWLQTELAARERHKIVFAHIPPHPQGADDGMYLARNDSRYFNALMDVAQPTAALFGHLHEATTESRIGRTRMITLRACCWNGDRSPLGFMVVRVTGEGIVTREVITGLDAGGPAQ